MISSIRKNIRNYHCFERYPHQDSNQTTRLTFPHYHQHDAMDCGPTCLRMVAKHYGKALHADALRQASGLGKEGVSLLGISEAAEKLGFRTQGVKIGLTQLWQCQLPCILHWSQYHFVVLYKIKRGQYHIADPAAGLRVLPETDFVGHWLSDKEGAEPKGIALLLEPTPAFFANAFDEQFVEEKVNSFWGVLRYLAPYKKMLVQLAIGVLLGSALQLVLPLLTQSVVDVGINTQNIPFLYLVLLAQLALFLGRLVVDFIRSWILYHISSRIVVQLSNTTSNKQELLTQLQFRFWEWRILSHPLNSSPFLSPQSILYSIR